MSATVTRIAFASMNAAEKAAYETWLNRNPYSGGDAVQRAFIAGRRTNKGWNDLDAAQKDWHRETCPDLCPVCEGHRIFGACTSCEAETEGIGADELSRCCGSRVNTRTEDPWSTR